MNGVIKAIRMKESAEIFKISMSSVLDKCCSSIASLLAVFVPLLIIHYADNSHSLNSSKIYATLE